MLLYYAHVAVRGEVVLQGLEFDQQAVRRVANHQAPEVRQPGPGADAGELLGLIGHVGGRAGIVERYGLQHPDVDILFPVDVEAAFHVFVRRHFELYPFTALRAGPFGPVRLVPGPGRGLMRHFSAWRWNRRNRMDGGRRSGDHG